MEWLPLSVFAVDPIPGGRAQYHPQLILALLVYCYANDIFSSQRIERSTHRDIGVRYVAAILHPDHDTIVDACWNALIAEPARITFIATREWAAANERERWYKTNPLPRGAVGSDAGPFRRPRT